MLVVGSVAVTALLYFIGAIASITVTLIPRFIMYHPTYLGNRNGLMSAVIFAAVYLITA